MDVMEIKPSEISPVKTFESFINEAKKDKGVVFTFGRFNPPTIGHGKLVDKLNKASKGGFHVMLFPTHSVDARKNPLTHKVKIKFLRKFFKKVKVIDTPARTIFDCLAFLYEQGYTSIRLVVGSDRVREFDQLIRTYNGKYGRHGHYDFKSIEIISAGERDPDSDDVSGMSASKLRMFADKGDFEEFKKGVPSKNKKDAETLYKAVRKGMGITESTLPTYILEDLIKEGVYDQGIFKAVFLMGGPGSGKSTIVNALSLKALGLKLVNTDTAFEKALKKNSISLDLRTIDPKVRDQLRGRAKELVAKGLNGYIQGRLGLIFDTTSAKKTKIQAYKALLDTLGYEYKMIYVNTSLANAQDRNLARSRKLPPAIVEKDWMNAQKHGQDYLRMFGNDFIEVKNDDTLDALKKKANKLYGQMLSWTSRFPSTKNALHWKEHELMKKAKG
tara:strand:- start:385 stop:1716 length:1332 start_codon:yes stop_codon:yes gene_type:complete